MRIRRTMRRLAVALAFATAGVLAAPGGASAAESTVPYLCPVEFLGESFVLNYSRSFDVTAPATVAPNQVFTVSFDPEPINPLPQFNTKVWDVKFVYNLPAGARVLGYALVGGYNLGDSQQKVEFSDGRVSLYASGPFAAGVDSDVPTLKVFLRAPSSGVLTTSVAGTSREDPGFRWTAEDPATGEVGELPCYPDPARPVVLSSTTVS
ncbi:hypothetical protein [Streptomyces macrosporus]|uniref:Secreted protein n=1 Tax=Streptomyces macrosporus TaxID=44032 RepID=A0ABP5WPV7_9ACTN